MSNVASSALGPFDLDCTIDLPPPLEMSAEQSFIALANASIHETEENKGEFGEMLRGILDETAGEELKASQKYGYDIQINRKALHAGKQLLKHGFDMMRLEVVPVAAPQPVLEVELDKLEMTPEEQAQEG